MLAIAGGKGGCGKTTTAVGLGRSFAARGARVLLVDADCDAPNLHTVTGSPYRPGMGALSDGAPLSRTIHESPDYPGVDVLPSGTHTGGVSPETLARVRDYPGRVVVDCPAGATSAVTGPIRAADAALVLSTATIQSQRDAVKTAGTVRSLETDLSGAVLIRVDEAGARCAGPLAEECRVVATIPDIEGPVLRRPVGRSTYGRLADYLTKRNA